MGSDYLFSKSGRFQIIINFEMKDGQFVKRPIIIDGKPEGKIYIEIVEGTGRGINK